MPPAVGTAIAGVAAGIAGIHGANKQAQATKESTAASVASNQAAIDEQKREDAITQANFDKTQAAQQAQWDAQQNIRAPYRQAGQAALSSLGDILGVSFGSGGGGGNAPAPSAQPSGLKGSAADLKALIDSGIDPASAAAKFNQQFGRTSGNEAVYYDPSQHGGVATVGLPDAYLSQEGNGWSITPRSGGSGTGTVRRSPTTIAPPAVAPTANVNALAPNYAPVVPFSQMMGR